MQSQFQPNLPETAPHQKNNWSSPVSSSILVSLASGPLVAGLVGQNLVNQWLPKIGQVSEEIFRGDRLPLLEFPDKQDS